MTGVNIIVHQIGLGPGSFDSKRGESHFLHEELEEPVFHFEELARPVRSLTQSDDFCIANHLFERLEVFESAPWFGGFKRNGVISQPCDNDGIDVNACCSG